MPPSVQETAIYLPQTAVSLLIQPRIKLFFSYRADIDLIYGVAEAQELNYGDNYGDNQKSITL